MLAYCVRAGMSLIDFYDAELWEVTAVLKVYFLEMEKQYKEQYHVARFQMSSMTDVKNVKFAWERNKITIEELSEEEKLRIEEGNKRLDERANNEYKAIQMLIEMNYTKLQATELISKAASKSKKVILPEELVRMSTNG